MISLRSTLSATLLGLLALPMACSGDGSSSGLTSASPSPARLDPAEEQATPLPAGSGAEAAAPGRIPTERILVETVPDGSADPAAPDGAWIEGLLAFDGGRAHEPEGRAGMLEVLAHALHFGGPTSLSGPEFHARLAERGAHLRVIAAEDALELEFRAAPADLAEVLDAAALLLTHPHYSIEAVAEARDVLIDRLDREAYEPSAVADAKLMAAVYGPAAPFTKRATPAEVETLERDELLTWHRDNLGLDRLWVAARGPIETNDLTLELERALAELPDVGPLTPVRQPALEVPAEPHFTAVVLPPGPTASAHTASGPAVELRLVTHGVDIVADDYAPLRVWSDVVGRRSGGGAFFASRWTVPGEAFGFVSAPSITAASTAFEALLAHLDGPALEPLAAAPLDAARGRISAAQTAVEATPRAMLEPVRHGVASNFWRRHGERLDGLSAEAVAAAAARHLDGARWAALGVFPSAPEVWPWPFEVVDGVPPLRGEPAAVAQLERTLHALGGRAGWRTLDHLTLGGEARLEGLSVPLPLTQMRDLAGERLRIDQALPGGAVPGSPSQVSATQIAGPEGVFSLTGSTEDSTPGESDPQVPARRITKLDDDTHAKVMRRERALLYRALRGLARGTTHSVDFDGEGALVVRRRGELLCTIALGLDHRPTSVRVPESPLEPERTTEFSEWAPHGRAGLYFAARMRDADDGRSFHWTSIDPDRPVTDADFGIR